MKSNPLFLCFLFLIGACLGIQAQSIPFQVNVNHPGTRALLDLPAGNNDVILCNLIPGNTYTVLANGAYKDQLTRFDFFTLPQEKLEATLVQNNKGDDNGIRFTALRDCQTLHILAANAGIEPMFVSVMCENGDQNKWLKSFENKIEAVNLSVDPAINGSVLIKNVLVGGNCYNVTNISSAGDNNSRGTFANGGSNIGINQGVVLATGPITELPGPNDLTNANGGFSSNSPDDPDLKLLDGGNQYDLSKLEFDFTPTANTVQFDFVFGSEEYCEYVGSQFNDVFGFFISGPGITGKKNIGLIPNTNTPVTTNNVNHQLNTNYYVNNNYASASCVDLNAFALNECQLDGWTKVLTATATVIPCETYHIKLAIADIADALYQSAVFLRANSFNAGGTAKVEAIYPPNQSVAYEGGCGPVFLKFSRDSSDLSQPLSVNFGITGTATPGLDYQSIASPVVIPANQNSILIPLNVFNDALLEGPETIQLIIENACSCTQSTSTITLDDKPDFNVSLSDKSLCTGVETSLSPLLVGGVTPFQFQWSTGASSFAIHINQGGNYAVEVRDACGRMLRDTANIVYSPAEVRFDTIRFCPGKSVTIHGKIYNQPGAVIDTLVGANNGCDTIVNYQLYLLPQVTIQQEFEFCPNRPLTVRGKTYPAPGLVQEILPGNNGACDTLASWNLIVSPYNTATRAISFCPGLSIPIGGNLYTESGTVLDTTIGKNGACDTIFTYILTKLPQPERSETILFCPGETIQLGNQNYTQPGSVVVRKPGTGGACDTLVSYTLKFKVPAASNLKITCPNSVTVNVPGGATSGLANYADATAVSNCVCPGINITKVSGLSSGSAFPLGANTICYKAEDACGQTASCCFDVRIFEESACDVKVIGCVKFELLGITIDVKQRLSYRIRTTNNCTNKLMYMLVEIPSGFNAAKPVNNSTYVAPGGHTYLVRNPNYAPYYSVRFNPLSDSIRNGEYDVFKYTLQAQADPDYIHVLVRLQEQIYQDAYLNTFYCPVLPEPSSRPENEERDAMSYTLDDAFVLFPNPSNGTLFADFSQWKGQNLQVRIFNAQGALLESQKLLAEGVQTIELAPEWTNGIYWLEVHGESGDHVVKRFVLAR